MNKLSLGFAAFGALALAACTTTPYTGPVEVTRFVAPTAGAQIGRGTVFVENAPGLDADSLALAPYKAAVAQELARLGYREASRETAQQVAQVRLEKYALGTDGARRGPVSVGVGGSTGSYGSGVGLGVGINLGGGQSRERLVTELGVMLRDKASGTTYWEGRAQFAVSANSRFAASSANAAAIAGALFRDFPGNNCETVEVRVNE
jgi:hypothetical protein